MHAKSAIWLVALALSTLAADARAGGDTCYVIEEINVQEGYIPSTAWSDINASGDMVGNYVLDETCTPDLLTMDSPQNGAVYHAATGEIETFEPPEGYVAVAWPGINDSGVVVGPAWGSSDSGLGSVGFIYEDGVTTVLDNPVEGTTDFAATDINNAGTIVGYSWCAESWCGYHSWTVDAKGVVNAVEVEGADWVLALSIANNGTVTGIVGGTDETGLSYGAAFYLDSHGELSTYATYDEDSFYYYYADGVNSRGQVAGYYYEVDSSDWSVLSTGAFLWDGAEDMEIVEVAGYSDVAFTGISASGDISGFAESGWRGLKLSPTKCP
ncbi:MAG: hypothetical protein JXB39_05305 [Deltaproteobacteria bacterium]|nr:hypothetical protein [Deltaproteobacteria bacterium]